MARELNKHLLKDTMANKYMKRCSPSYVIIEMWIKTRYHYSPWGRKESDTTEWLTHTHTHTPLHTYSNVKIQTQTKANTGENVEKQELCFVAGGNAKWDGHFGKTVGQFLTKINVLLAYNLAVSHSSVLAQRSRTLWCIQQPSHKCL